MWRQKQHTLSQLNNHMSLPPHYIFKRKHNKSVIRPRALSWGPCTETVHYKMSPRHPCRDTCVLIHTNNPLHLLPPGCWCRLNTQRASQGAWSSMTMETGSMPTTVSSTTRRVDSFKSAFTTERRYTDSQTQVGPAWPSCFSEPSSNSL